MRELTVSNGLIETVIITSDEHPFYVLNKGFIPASELKASDQLVNLDFNVLKVISNKRIEQSMPMYNFEVADYHTYAVSEQNVWVHNKCFSGWINRDVYRSLSPEIKKKFEKAIEKGIVPPKGHSGVVEVPKTDALYKEGFTHKLKILGHGGDIRIYGKLQENGHIIYSKKVGH